MQDLLKKLLFGNAGGSNGGSPSLNLSFVDGGTFDPRITFSRGTNATLTGSNGLIQYAPHNLLTNSEDFEAAAWAKASGATITPNSVVAPDGTTTGDTLSLPTGGGASQLYQSTSVVNGPVTASMWIRADTPITLSFGFFDSTGDVTSISVTTSWQRVTWTRATGLTSADRRACWLYNGSVGAATVYVWGAQLNVGALQTYNSTTPKNLLGFTQEPENAAWTKSNSYVQQNLLTFSEDITNAAWLMLGSAGASRLADVTLAPNGSLTADSYSVGTGSGSWYIANYANAGIVSGQSYTFSVYLKANGCNFAFIRPHNNSSNFGASGFIVSLVDGTITYPSSPTAPASTGTATAVGNGWWRVTATSTANLTTATTGGPGVWPCQTNAFAGTNGVAPANFTGNGTDGVFIWGAQLVQGADAGQYTQTTSAAAVTRYTNWDGTLTGRKLVEDTALANHGLSVSFTYPATSVYVLSVYAKQDTRSRLELSADTADAQAYCLVNLATGTVIQAGTSVTPTITPVGGGWYRCAIALTVASGAKTIRLRMGNSANDYFYTGDGTSGIYVSDFQLSNSASVDPYVYNPQAAAASAAFYGPRIDYNPTGTPIPSGVELVTNGTFDSASGWSTGGAWVISGGAASITAGTAALSQSTLAAVAGRTYQVTFTISAFSSGGVRFEFGGINGTSRNAAGTYTQYITTSSTAFLVISPTATSTLSIDNVSVQEVTGYTATANGLLIEEQRTNLLTYSDDFTNAVWTKLNATITANSTTSPDGASSADTLVETAATGAHRISQAFTPTVAAHTTSVYARASTRTWLVIQNDFGSNNTSQFYNIGSGVLGSQTGLGGTATITLVGNGWYRCTLTTTTTTITAGAANIYVTTGDGVTSYAGDGTSGIFLWGSQLELGAFPTSYIPTVASQVTRNADSASMLGDNFYTWYNPNQGTLSSDYIISNAQVAGAPGVASISDNTNGNRIQVSNVSGDRRAIVTSGGVVQFVAVGGALGAASVGVAAKLAVAYKTSDFAACANAGTVVTQASGSVPGGLSRMYVGAAGDGNFQLNGTIRSIRYYTVRLPDATLQQITS